MDEDADKVARALGHWATRMAAGLRIQAEAYDILVSALSDAPLRQWSPAADLPLPERPQRQALLLAAVHERARQLQSSGIPRSEWMKLAVHFGYDPRGTAGFFRRSSDGTEGLMARDPERDFVHLASAGFSRIEQYEAVVKENREQIAAAFAEHEYADKP